MTTISKELQGLSKFFSGASNSLMNEVNHVLKIATKQPEIECDLDIRPSFLKKRTQPQQKNLNIECNMGSRPEFIKKREQRREEVQRLEAQYQEDDLMVFVRMVQKNKQ